MAKSRNVGFEVLDPERAAAYLGFTGEDFLNWVELGLFPAADPSADGWSKESLDKALDDLRQNGWASHHDLPHIQRQPRTNTLELTRHHHYRRGVRGALEGEPGSGTYMISLIEKNRQYARQQTGGDANPTATRRDKNKTTSAAADEQGKLPRTTSDAVLHMGGLAPADQQLPLYPSELEIGQAVLGTDRAHEWPTLAARLERDGLPPIDPLMGARFWPAVQKFFEDRHGLDGGLAVRPRSRAASTSSHYLTVEELIDRWRNRVSPETLANWRSAKFGPPFTKIARQIFYPLPLLEQWERQHLTLCDLSSSHIST